MKKENRKKNLEKYFSLLTPPIWPKDSCRPALFFFQAAGHSSLLLFFGWQQAQRARPLAQLWPSRSTGAPLFFSSLFRCHAGPARQRFLLPRVQLGLCLSWMPSRAPCRYSTTLSCHPRRSVPLKAKAHIAPPSPSRLQATTPELYHKPPHCSNPSRRRYCSVRHRAASPTN